VAYRQLSISQTAEGKSLLSAFLLEWEEVAERHHRNDQRGRRRRRGMVHQAVCFAADGEASPDIV
jgi:hypothetical protein